MEKVRLEPLVMSKHTFLEKYPQPAIIEQSHGRELITEEQQQEQQEQTKIIDVFGQKTEPICNYHRCHHKFSSHGHSSRVCKCNHPQNHTIGISILLLSS
jgi:hypothetical protein